MNKVDKNYTELLEKLKQRVKIARYSASLTANKELIHLYHSIGTQILNAQKAEGWGAKIVTHLSKDLRSAFPEMKGFSPQNLKYMRRFAEEYLSGQISQQAVDQLPWGHIITLIYNISDSKERKFYIQKAIEYGWSRNLLSMQIETKLFQREGKAVTNFQDKLESPQSDKAQSILKNPYLFDFLNLGQDPHEREIEKELIRHIEKFLLELGEGFAFVGRQFHLEIGNKDYYIDLLFYHLKLRCFVVIELKNREFKPEYAGKINFYLSAVDDLIKHPTDNPSIGLILCQDKDSVTAEYALRDMNKPIGLANYYITENLPKNIKTELPTIEELEAELVKNLKDNAE